MSDDELQPGSIEHRVLNALAEHPGDDEDILAGRLYGRTITYAQRQEMHAALARLHGNGLDRTRALPDDNPGGA